MIVRWQSDLVIIIIQKKAYFLFVINLITQTKRKIQKREEIDFLWSYALIIWLTMRLFFMLTRSTCQTVVRQPGTRCPYIGPLTPRPTPSGAAPSTSPSGQVRGVLCPPPFRQISAQKLTPSFHWQSALFCLPPIRWVKFCVCPA